MPLNEKKQNKGFAYVDFTTPAVYNIALALSEKLVNGRACLIKSASSFEGRPKVSNEAKAADAAAKAAGKEPTKRVFVGNLGFEATREEINEHFSQAGQVDDVFLATFEDSGKCKGFGWVTFADVESASQAVRGFIWKKQEEEEEIEDEDKASQNEDDSDEEDKKPKRKPKKPMKWFINRIHGRELRCEFAEDKQTRYKKRYGKAPPATTERSGGFGRYNEATAGEARRGEDNLQDLLREAAEAAPKRRDPKVKSMSKDERQDFRRQKFDSRKIAPGRAMANKERSDKATGAIPKTAGTKKTFD
jgi:RNA recognition motif-containing protein